jgi:hypothetical protein
MFGHISHIRQISHRGITVVLATGSLACVTGLTAPVAEGAVSQPAGGTTTICNNTWKAVDVPGVADQQVKIIDDDFGSNSCLSNSGNVGFDVTKSTSTGSWTEYPNISTGWERGEEPAEHAAWKFPVEVSQDGSPWADVTTGAVEPSSAYNAAYDIWFDKTGETPVPSQATGAEVMIWLQHENVDGPAAGSAVYTIDGIQWQAMKWIATYNHKSWNYIAFVAVSQHTSASLSLNPFFQKAEELGSLKSSWYLTSVDFGFEIPRGGVGLRVNSFKFGGVK